MDGQHKGPYRPRHRPDPLLTPLGAALDALEVGPGGVLVATSGGLDSTVLAHALAALAPGRRLRLTLGHVHHGLRGADADADADAARALGATLGVPVRVRRVAPQALREGASSRQRLTLQEAARALRHAALVEMADAAGGGLVVTAHHANDQAETVLLRLLRGTGPDGLGGIPERSPDGRVVRPLLSVPRAALHAYALRHDLRWREDASNESDAYTRNRIRRHWLPALAEAFNPKLLRALADLAEAQRRDGEWIEQQVAREAARRFSVEGTWLRIDSKDWESLPAALARRLARAALARGGAGRHVSRTHLSRMLRFFATGRPGAALELPGGLRLQRHGDGFRLGPLPPAPGSRPQGAC